MNDIKQYLEETNTVLLTKEAFEYLKERACVLDKIRAEIDANREQLKIMADDDWYAGKIRGYDCSIEIIDRYKKPWAESEEQA